VTVIAQASATAINAASTATSQAVAKAAASVCNGGDVNAAAQAAATATAAATGGPARVHHALRCLTRKMRQLQRASCMRVLEDALLARQDSRFNAHSCLPFAPFLLPAATAVANATVTVITTGQASGCGSATASGESHQ